MGHAIHESDLRALLDIIDVGTVDDTGVGLPTAVLDKTQQLIACDVVSFAEFDPGTHGVTVIQDTPAVLPVAPDDIFWLHYWDCLPCSYPSRTGDTRSVISVSDFYSARQWHDVGMYVDYLGLYGVEHELVMCLPVSGSGTRRLLLNRGRGVDFDDRDRLLLALLRPHLAELNHRLELSRRGVPSLTARQWELLGVVATGSSNREIANRLFISESTVRKHLENIFERLDVSSRTAAVARVFPLPDRLGNG